MHCVLHVLNLVSCCAINLPLLSWFLYKNSPDSILTESAKKATELLFVVARPSCAEAAATLQAEMVRAYSKLLTTVVQQIWKRNT